MLARRTMTLLLVLLAALMLAACGGDDDSGSDDSGNGDTAAETSDDSGDDAGDDGSNDDAAAGGQTLDLGVDGNNLVFAPTELTATAGSVTLKLTNTSSIQHNVAIESKDGVSEITVDLEPGTYTYYCSPHKSAGMTGTLTVS